MNHTMLVLLLLFFVSCSSEETTVSNPPPANLLVDITVIGVSDFNQNGDGSGLVQISATAQYAVRYTFQFDDLEPIESSTGVVNYQFLKEGLHTYDIKVNAYASSGDEISKQTSVAVFRSNQIIDNENLVFSDEFNYEGRPNTEKWHHQVIPPANGGWFNDELQHYTDREVNSYVSNGTLKIVGRREQYTTNGSTKSYTSARMNSKFAFTYGRVEFRARLPKSAGTWPALWTLGANINETGNYFGGQYGSVGWPLCGEIDILEQTGWNKNQTIGHFHWGDLTTQQYNNEGGTISISNADTEFHIFSMDWREDKIQIFMDGRLVHQLQNSVNKPFNDLHYLLMNIAIGGTLGGNVPSTFTEDVFEIDYVRVYR